MNAHSLNVKRESKRGDKQEDQKGLLLILCKIFAKETFSFFFSYSFGFIFLSYFIHTNKRNAKQKDCTRYNNVTHEKCV